MTAPHDVAPPAEKSSAEKAQTFSPKDRLLKAIRNGDVVLVAGDEERFRALSLDGKELDRLRNEGVISGFNGAKEVELDDDPTVMVTGAHQGTSDPDLKGRKLNHVHGGAGRLDEDFFGEDAAPKSV